MNRISVLSLKAGMVVDEPIYIPSSDQLLLQHGITLTPKMIEQLKYHKIQKIAVSIPDSRFVNPRDTLAIQLNNFFDSKINEISPDSPEGNLNDNMPEIACSVKDILRRVTRNEVVLNLSVEIKLVSNQKLFYPSIYSCIRASLLAGALGLSDQEIYNIAAAALLQNLGLCEMPYLLELKQRNAAQETLWREHCEYGYYFSKEAGLDNDIANLIKSHHEQFDGSGYPRQLRGDEIPMGAKIINLCSDFDEMIFINKMKPHQIVEIFFATCDAKYDSRVIDAFMMNIPLYPLGSIVRLSNKEVGVVVNIRENINSRPIVRVCYNSCNKPYKDTTIVDLGDSKDLVIEEVLN